VAAPDQHLADDFGEAAHSTLLSLVLQADTLATDLGVRRYTLTPAPAPPGGGDTLTYTFDPRFVGFEFSASLMLRESQAL
jgi:hypothetical protein